MRGGGRSRPTCDREATGARNLIIDIHWDFKCQVNRLVFEISHAGLTERGGAQREGGQFRSRKERRNDARHTGQGARDDGDGGVHARGEERGMEKENETQRDRQKSERDR